ncbi:hypothetical protein E4M02_04325 [Brevundimonas sp. S30B]|uniref:hypothetical protein n=1 Tax=unclassified Brevundimonas TaxID=2622653 RepID=UPI001072EADB|nr:MULTISPECIES: hypothetical protein [unclassified Brevundimonas]QBX36903.1 hypothetical protein E4M01_03490 [Brevundimonas sp. MF30-B]TFW04302.1 hypothetical protein E4M02_04325 [Brevundimonas sp. S30B]
MNEPNIEGDVKFILGEIRGQLASLIALVGDKHDQYDKKFDQHETRLGGLERSKAWLLGAAAALGGIASFLMNLVTK